MIKSAFERYAPFIQNYIYRKKWTDLREVQIEACEAIMDTDKHVLVASGTSSGKTEAVFFPMLTLLSQKTANSVGIIYISPLKALINDQFERLGELLEDSGIPVWPWHGDISQSVKKKALQKAEGVLQITPESLEALLMRHPGEAEHLFNDLRFVVIDEIHALMNSDRGLQVMCLLSRLEKLTGCKMRRIGLSATLNDYDSVKTFLSMGSQKETIAVGMQNYKRKIALCVESFVIPEVRKIEEKIQEVEGQYNNFIYEQCHNKKCLIFTNSRGKAEKIISDMKRIAGERQEKDVFYVHHGSMSASLRKETELTLKEHNGPAVAAATLTLELGIDIGDLDMTIQLGAPYTCSGFVQRLGRSGRRTGKSQMLFINLFEQNHTDLFGPVPWDLLRSIAVIQLYLEERWVEPFEEKRKPYSLLAHQTLSNLMTYGELSPKELAEKVVLSPVFRNKISPDEYKKLLQYMIQEEYLQKTENGKIIVGLKGERITNHYSFYAVFEEEKAYHVMSQEGEIGTLTKCPVIDEVFVLAGRCWKVISIDDERRNIYVKKEKNIRIPSWCGNGGYTHTRIIQRMKQIVEENLEYAYLRPNAKKLLQQTRLYMRENHMTESMIIPQDEHSFYLCPWMGTKQVYTLANLLSCGLKQELKIVSVRRNLYYLYVVTGLSIEEWIRRFKEYKLDINNPDMVFSMSQIPRIDKYDFMVPEELLKKAYLENEMDVAGIYNKIMEFECR